MKKFGRCLADIWNWLSLRACLSAIQELCKSCGTKVIGEGESFNVRFSEYVLDFEMALMIEHDMAGLEIA